MVSDPETFGEFTMISYAPGHLGDGVGGYFNVVIILPGFFRKRMLTAKVCLQRPEAPCGQNFEKIE